MTLLQYTDADVTVPYVYRLLCVMRLHFENGGKIYEELLRAAREWQVDGQPAELREKHYARIEDAHSGKDMQRAKGGGLYTGIAPIVSVKYPLPFCWAI